MNRAKVSYCFSNNVGGKVVDGKFVEFKGVLDDTSILPLIDCAGYLVFKPNNNTRSTVCMVVTNPEISGSRSAEIYEKGETICYPLPELEELTGEEWDVLYKKIEDLDWVFRVYLIGGGK